LRWALVGIVALACSYLLVKPTFTPTPSPPQPWGLWISTDTEATGERPTAEPDWLLTLKIEAPTNCNEPATVIGSLEWKPKEVTDVIDIKEPKRLLIAIAGVRVLHAEVDRIASIDPASPRELAWRAQPLLRQEGEYLLQSPVTHWTVSQVTAKFRLKLMAARSAGFDSCYVASPAVASIGEGVGGSEQAWTNVGENVTSYVEAHHLSDNLERPLALDAVVQMSVPHEEPDRAALDAGAHVQRKRAILACTTHERAPPREIEDQYYDYLTHLTERFCSSVQTFRASNASVKLIERGFLSAILVAGSVTLLLQALMGNSIIPPPERPGSRRAPLRRNSRNSTRKP
jgi:hypothetical protein